MPDMGGRVSANFSIRFCGSVSAYHRATRWPRIVCGVRLSPTHCAAMSGTEIAYGLRTRDVRAAMSGTDLAYAARRCPAMLQATRSALLSAYAICYAMSGTDLAYAAIGLCACYGMSARVLSTYARAMECPGMLLPACYGMNGTDLVYGATSTPAPPPPTLLRISQLRYPPTRPYACCAMSGTEIAYGAMVWYGVYGTEIAYSAICFAIGSTEISEVLRHMLSSYGLAMGCARTGPAQALRSTPHKSNGARNGNGNGNGNGVFAMSSRKAMVGGKSFGQHSPQCCCLWRQWDILVRGTLSADILVPGRSAGPRRGGGLRAEPPEKTPQYKNWTAGHYRKHRSAKVQLYCSVLLKRFQALCRGQLIKAATNPETKDDCAKNFGTKAKDFGTKAKRKQNFKTACTHT
eukprot:2049702-Rhodomonas_salina.1